MCHPVKRHPPKAGTYGISHPELPELRAQEHDVARFLRPEIDASGLDGILTLAERIAARRSITGFHDLLASDNEWEPGTPRVREAPGKG